MSAQFGLFLGEDRIPVINWINRHGAPEGRNLRFTVPTEVKARLEANKDATYRLERDGQQWEFELLSVTQHCTGTNGVPAVGRVKGGAPAKVEPAKKPATGVGIPKLDGAAEEPKKDHGFNTREGSSLKELLLRKKAERQAERETAQGVPAPVDPATADGLPTSELEPESEASVSDTTKGMPAVSGNEEE